LKKNNGAAGFLRTGIEHFNAGRYAPALRSFRRARALGDRSPALRSFIAHALGAAEPRGARRRLVEALRLRGQARLSAGDLADAQKALLEALRLEPRDRSVRGRLLDILRSCGHACQFTNRWDEAEAIFRRLLRENARDARAWHGLAGVMRSRGKIREERIYLGRALRAGGGALTPSDRFKALMKLGRYKAAVAAAELILEGKPVLSDIRIFWDPWEWDDRRPREDRRAELKRLERALGADAKSPWLHYYRAELNGGLEGLSEFARIAAFPRRRYGWMFAKAGLAALCNGVFPKAAEWFKIALSHKPADWRTHGFLAETYLCLRRPGDAVAEMERARRAAPEEDAGQVLAWRGAVDLWLGRYDEALARLEEACRLDAACAYCWRAAALLKLGRPKEALDRLDETLRRFPRDFEAYVWRGEAKRELGLYDSALKDLNEEMLAVPRREPPIWLWALVNRALVKEALGDRAGLEADFNALPAYVVDHVRAKTGFSDMADLLRASLDLSRGFRREEYRQAIWMS